MKPVPLGPLLLTVRIVDGPLGPADHAPPIPPGLAGAVITFEGTVRRDESGRELVALDYEVYQPMAQTTLERLAAEISTQFDLLALQVTHSKGRVRVGECSLRVTAHSRHRAEGLAAVGALIDRLKKDVPIWKRGVV